MEQVRILAPQENVWLDQGRLQSLCANLGEVGAEEVVCRAMEEVAVRLSQAEKHFRAADMLELARVARSLVAIADQVGMEKLARVAGDVCTCAKAGDTVSIAATLSRMVRVGERSLNAIWDADQFGP